MKHFEFGCVGVSEKLHRIMDKNKKKNWACPTCTLKKVKTKINKYQTNVTTRKKNNAQNGNQTTNTTPKNTKLSSTLNETTTCSTFLTESESCHEETHLINISTSNSFETLSDDECTDTVSTTQKK